MSTCCTTPAFEPPAHPAPDGTLRTVVLIGPPNSGKSTLFNRLTGLRQKVANYPGVTVEQRMGLMAGVGRDDLTLIDLPGVYSLSPYSEDARVSIDVLKGKMPGTPKPDAVLLVLDSLHLTRQLMLAAPVLALGLPTLVLLNMSDLMESRGGAIDALKLARELGAPVAQISAVHRTGLESVTLFLNQHAGPALAKPLSLPVLGNAASTHSWAAQISRRTGYQAPLSAENSRRIDNILLHRIWGPLLFLVVVVGVFEVVFSIGQPLSDGFGDILARMGDLVRPLLPVGWLQSLLLDGAWKGISSVLVFLPQILLQSSITRSARRLQQNLGEGDKDRRMPFHAPSRRRDWSQPTGNSGRARSGVGEDIAKPSGRLADGGNPKNADNDDEGREQYQRWRRMLWILRLFSAESGASSSVRRLI